MVFLLSVALILLLCLFLLIHHFHIDKLLAFFHLVLSMIFHFFLLYQLAYLLVSLHNILLLAYNLLFHLLHIRTSFLDPQHLDFLLWLLLLYLLIVREFLYLFYNSYNRILGFHYRILFL